MNKTLLQLPQVLVAKIGLEPMHEAACICQGNDEGQSSHNNINATSSISQLAHYEQS